MINPWFIAAFFGPGVACLILAIAALRQWEQPSAIYLLVGSMLYLIGTIGVTIAGNIPLNDALAIVTPDSTEGTELWARYLTSRTVWNHVRTIAACLAAILLTLSLYVQTEVSLCGRQVVMLPIARPPRTQSR